MKRWNLLLAAIVILGLTGMVLACPMCKDSLAETKPDAANASLFAGGGGVSGGFNISIYCMILGFFTALSVVVINVARGLRKR
jgi:hypothetical protein